MPEDTGVVSIGFNTLENLLDRGYIFVVDGYAVLLLHNTETGLDTLVDIANLVGLTTEQALGIIDRLERRMKGTVHTVTKVH